MSASDDRIEGENWTGLLLPSLQWYKEPISQHNPRENPAWLRGSALFTGFSLPMLFQDPHSSRRNACQLALNSPLLFWWSIRASISTPPIIDGVAAPQQSSCLLQQPLKQPVNCITHPNSSTRQRPGRKTPPIKSPQPLQRPPRGAAQNRQTRQLAMRRLMSQFHK